MLRRLHASFTGLPRLMRLGLLIVLAGGVLDTLYHALPIQSTELVDAFLGQGAWSIHLVALAGMAITMIGIFAGWVTLKTIRIRRSGVERSHSIED